MTRLFCLGLVASMGLPVGDALHAEQPHFPNRIIGTLVWVPQRTPSGYPPDRFSNSIGMSFIWIPPGSFVMGSPKEEIQRYENETQHKVTFAKGFFMGTCPVTQEEWQAVMGDNPSDFKGQKNLPVEFVSWERCQEFCRKLHKKDQKQYRLPTEAEWEYCCRAGTTTPFHFGETLSADQANHNGAAAGGTYRKKTTPVGSFPASAWGLHDMHGNVYQWCQDWYRKYPKEDVVDPQGPETGSDRVLRGGSWHSTQQNCRSASRNGFQPDSRYNNLGFRVCFCYD